MNEKSMEVDKEYRVLQEIVEEKDNVIAIMQDQISKLTTETKRLSKDKD